MQPEKKKLLPLTRAQLQHAVDDLCQRVKHGPKWKDHAPVSLFGSSRSGHTVKDLEQFASLKIEAEQKHMQHAANLVGMAWGAEWPE